MTCPCALVVKASGWMCHADLCDVSLTTGSYATGWHVIYPVHENDALCVFGDESDHTHHIGSDNVLFSICCVFSWDTDVHRLYSRCRSRLLLLICDSASAGDVVEAEADSASAGDVVEAEADSLGVSTGDVVEVETDSRFCSTGDVVEVVAVFSLESIAMKTTIEGEFQDTTHHLALSAFVLHVGYHLALSAFADNDEMMQHLAREELREELTEQVACEVIFFVDELQLVCMNVQPAPAGTAAKTESKMMGHLKPLPGDLLGH